MNVNNEKKIETVHCEALGCSNQSRKKLQQGEQCGKVSFFKFPKEELRKAIWVRALGRDRWIPAKESRVCSDHFSEDQIDRTHSRCPQLRENAVPNVFRHVDHQPPSKPKMETSRKRKGNTQKKETLGRRLAKHIAVGAPKRNKKTKDDQMVSNGEEVQYLTGLDPPEVPVNENSATKHRLSNQGKERKRDSMAEEELEGDMLTSAVPTVETHSVSVSTQVDFNFPESQFTFICDRRDSETVGVQCNLPTSTIISNPGQCRGFHSYQSIGGDDRALDVLCGVNLATFDSLKDNLNSQISVILDKPSVLLLFLMKLRLGLPFAVLEILFGVHRGTAKGVFFAVLGKLCSASSGYWPFMLDINSELPPFFQGKYADTRLIVGCAKIKAQRVDGLEPMYSTGGERYAFKMLIGINPSGVITYKSKVYCGRASDAFIAQDSGLLDLLKPEDLILTDSTFPPDIDGRICPVLPPKDDCCRPEELQLDKMRLHVEMCLERVKQFRILHSVPSSLFLSINAILHICCYLVNHRSPIFEIKDDQFHIENEEF